MRRYEVKEKIDNKTELKVVFDSLADIQDALSDLQVMRTAYALQSTIQSLRARCESPNGVYYIPASNQELPKARWVMLAAAASFPNGVPVSEPLEKLGISKSALDAYCTSKNNPTSEYLNIKDNMIFTTSGGISWVQNLLEPKSA